MHKIISFTSIGILGFSLIRLEFYPPLFFLFSVFLSFSIFIMYSCLISMLSKSSKLRSIVGVSSLSGPGLSYVTVLSVFFALLCLSGMSLKIAFLSASELRSMLKIDFISAWAFQLIYLISFCLFSLIIKNGSIIYMRARYCFVVLLISISIINIMDDQQTILENIVSTDRTIPIEWVSLSDFLSVTAITLSVLLYHSVECPNLLKGNTLSSVENSFISLIFPCSIGAVSYLFLMYCNGKDIFSSLTNNSLIQNPWLKYMLNITFSICALLFSAEYLEKSHFLIYQFFNPLFQESLASLKIEYVRKTCLIIISFGFSYALTFKERIYIVFVTLSSLILVPVFLIFPPIISLIRYRNFSTPDFRLYSVFGNLFIFAFGALIFSIHFFGYGIYSQSYHNIIPALVLDVCHEALSTIFLCLGLYFFLMLLDFYFYPKSDSPISHRIIHSVRSINYGPTYVVEILIIAFIILTLSDTKFYITNVRSSNLIESAMLFCVKSLALPLTHGGYVHLILNSMALYSVGKFLSSEVGPFHFLAYFFGTSLIAGVCEKFINIHLFGETRGNGIGASDAILAIIVVFAKQKGIQLSFFSIPISGLEYIVYLIIASIIFICFDLLPKVSHMSHLCGIFIGFFFLDVSNFIWSYRDYIGKKIFRQK
jgi:membrane associated rhomboid family serine protease